MVKCFSRSEVTSRDGATKFVPLPLSLVRKFARKARAFRCAYRAGASNTYAQIEKHVKDCKVHRSALDSEYKFVSEGL